MRRLSLFWLVSIPQLRASLGRTLLVIAGTLTGVALIVAINIINTSAVANVRRSIALIAGPADLQVTLGVGEIGFPESTVETVRSDPDVQIAVPLLRGTVSLADRPEETLQLFGADLTAEENLQRYTITSVTDRRGVIRALEDPASVLLTEAFATRRSLTVGSAIQLSTPIGIHSFVVRGLLRPDGLAVAFGGQLAVMDLAAAQRWLDKENRVDQIDVVLRAGASVVDVARRLQAALPATLTVEQPLQRGLQYERILSSFQAMLTGLSLLCLIAGIFIIYNTTSTGALNRAIAMASLRRIGATPAQLFRLLMVEALLLGTTGTLLGMSVGIFLARLLVRMVTQSMGVIFQLRFSPDAETLDPRQLVVIALVGIAATLFASCFAALRVASMDPLTVMRGHARRSSPRSNRALAAWWIVLVAISAAAFVCERHFKSIAWGNFGATLWNGAVIVIAIPLVAWLSAFLTRMLSRLFGAEGEVAATSLFRSPTRTGVTTAAVALVLTVGITLSSLEVSFHRTTETYVNGFLHADIVVSAVATEGGWLETPLPQEVPDEISKIPGVRGVETVRALPGQLFQGERIGVGGGSDGLLDPSRLPTGWYREGNPESAAEEVRAGRAANVSTALADRFDLHVGDVIKLDTPTGQLALPIVGVVPDLISDRGSVLISRRLLIDRWQEPTVSRILVEVQSGESLETIRSRIADQLGRRYRLKVLSMRDVIAYHHDKVSSAFAFTDAIQLLIVIVTIAGIFDLLLSAIVERRRELAVWRLIGADDRAVRRSVVIESATVGAIGAMLGVAVGAITALLWIVINFRYLLGYHLEHHFAVGSTIWYVTLVIAMTMLAGYAAARQATRHSILDGIRTQ